MQSFIFILQTLSGLSLIFLVLIQSRGKGLSGTISSRGASFTRRGLDKFLFRFTFFVVFTFIAASVVQIVF